MKNIPFKIRGWNPSGIRARMLQRKRDARYSANRPLFFENISLFKLRSAVCYQVSPQFPASLCDEAHQSPPVIRALRKEQARATRIQPAPLVGFRERAGAAARNLYKRAIRDRLSRGNSRCDRPGRHPGSAAFQNDEAGFGRAQI